MANEILVGSGVGIFGGRDDQRDKDLTRVDHKKFLNNKPDLPPHRDFNDKWDDDDDWPEERPVEEEVSILFEIAAKKSPGWYDAGQVTRTDAQHRLRENIPLCALYPGGGA
ncbi:inner membrane protein [Klebsiella michiganensis]|nr:inner membrane protein [Klebsiella michiganensis]